MLLLLLLLLGSLLGLGRSVQSGEEAERLSLDGEGDALMLEREVSGVLAPVQLLARNLFEPPVERLR
jgi:hypothetical protein